MFRMIINDTIWFLKKYYIIIFLIFFFHTLFCRKVLGTDYNRWNTLAVYFMGYDKINVHLFQSLFYQFPLWLLCLTFIREKILNLTVYAVIKLRSIKKWIAILIIDCVIFILIFYFIGFTITYGITNVFDGPKEELFHMILPQLKNTYNPLVLFFNLSVMSLTVILLSIILWLIMKNGAAGFTIVLILHILCAILTGIIPGLGRFLPTVHGMIILQDNQCFTYYFACIYGLAVLFLCLLILFCLLEIYFERIIQNNIDEKE